MLSREKVHNEIYSTIKSAIESIEEDMADDIYALWIYIFEQAVENDLVINFQYSCKSHFENQRKNPDQVAIEWHINHGSIVDDLLIKWETCFSWRDDKLTSWYTGDSTTYWEWLEESANCFYTKENCNLFDLYDKVELNRDNFFTDCFIEELILIVKNLFEENVVLNKFNKNIPIIIDEYTFDYEEVMERTRRANPEGVADEYFEWAKRDIIHEENVLL